MNNILIEKSSIDFEDNGEFILKENGNKDIRVNDNVDITLTIINEEDKDVSYNFDINENCNLIFNIFDASKNINRNINVNINGKNSNVLINISSISLNENNYNVSIHHNNKNCTSNTNIHGLTIDNNSIYIKNNGYIPNGSEKSVLHQDNKIIIMNDNKSKIEPNLFIDEYDVEASHGAYIGKFDEEELFYLNSRGLDENKCYELLINGFLLNEFNITDDVKDDLKKIIKKYWRLKNEL